MLEVYAWRSSSISRRSSWIYIATSCLCSFFGRPKLCMKATLSEHPAARGSNVNRVSYFIQLQKVCQSLWVSMIEMERLKVLFLIFSYAASELARWMMTRFANESEGLSQARSTVDNKDW